MLKPAKLAFEKVDKLFASFGKGGWIKIILRTIKHKIFNDTWQTYDFPWVVLDRGDSVAVLIHDSFLDDIVLVEQFRPAMEESVLEIVAGAIGVGEDPEACARREVKEEVDLEVEELRLISVIYPSPGATNEKVYIYQATVNALGPDGLEGGLKSEGEHILKHVVSVNEAQAMVDLGIIKDAKTIIAIQNAVDEDEY